MQPLNPQDTGRITLSDNFRYVVPEDDTETVHSPTRPFCAVDPTCLCHEDPILIAEVAQKVEDGLLTDEEATRLVKGEQI